jgi:hypothetical protein
MLDENLKKVKTIYIQYGTKEKYYEGSHNRTQKQGIYSFKDEYWP